jgi:transcriptional regulator with XRE-family HTH domain
MKDRGFEMITSIGKFLRKLRIESGEILKDMADTLGVSSAFLSAVENGKKKMPESWLEKLAETYFFTEKQVEELKVAVIESNNTVELNLKNTTPERRALAISFAREFETLDKETSNKIYEILKKRRGE